MSKKKLFKCIYKNSKGNWKYEILDISKDQPKVYEVDFKKKKLVSKKSA